jgi:hypothetical protein
MNVLYIHGLDSFPRPERLEALRRRGHFPLALHLDYRTEEGCYARLRAYALEGQAEYIVGSSLGGFLGCWLGQELGLPALLFNPAMHIETGRAEIPAGIGASRAARWVVLGADDEVLDPQRNWAYFAAEEAREGQQVMLLQGLGHCIPLPVFEASLRWAGL